jgi:peptide/nickel transport system substrate-binding protein
LLGWLEHPEKPLQDLRLAKMLVDSVHDDFPDEWKKVQLSTTSDYADLCAALQFQWRTIGLDIGIEVLSPATHREQVSLGQSMMFRKSWLADYADAENFLGLFHSKNFSPGGPNYTHYHSLKFDSIFETSMTHGDEAMRLETHRQMNAMVASDFPVIPLFHDQVTHFIRNDIEGWVISPVNRLDLRRVRKTGS